MSIPIKIALILALWAVIFNMKLESCGGMLAVLILGFVLTGLIAIG